MGSTNQSFMNSSRNTSRRNSNNSLLFSNRNLDESMASRQSKEDSLISTNRYKSPFYEGKVSFGGLSAKRVRLSQVLPYNLANKPTSVTRIKDSEIKRLNEFDQLSNATKNMLQNIYKASSPLEDAKKIPVFNSSLNQSNEKYMIENKPFKRLSSLRTPRLASNLKTSSPIDREKLQLKWEELENSTNQSINHRTSSSQHNLIADASASYCQKDLEQSSAGGKMKTRLTRTNRLKKWSDNDNNNDYLQSHELPNISLPINNNSLPTFNFNKRLSQPQTTLNQFDNKSNINNLKRSLISITQDEDSVDDDEFQFSVPKAIKLEKISESFLNDSIKRDIDQPKSSFLNQISKIDKNNQQEQLLFKITSTTSVPTITSTTNLPPIKPSTESMSSETNKTVEMYKLDKLDTDFNPKENKATLANTNLPINKSAVDNKISNSFNFDGLTEFNKKQAANKMTWECDTCAVRNELSSNKCAACEQPRLKESKDKNVNNIYSNYSFGTINTEKKGFNAFKLDSKTDTKTDTKSTISQQQTTSIASNSTLSNPLPTIPTLTFTNNNSFGNITTSNKVGFTEDKTIKSTDNESISSTKPNEQIKEPVKPFTFVTNEVADKIDSNKSSSIKATCTSSIVNSSINTWDKKFMPPKENWNCPDCFANNKPTDKKCVCCEAANPNQPKDESKDDKPSTGLTFNSSSTTGGFKFNLPPTTNTSTTKNEFSSFLNKTNLDQTKSTGFSFGNLATSSTTNKSTDVPKLNFGSSLNSNNQIKQTDSSLNSFWSNESNSWKCVNCSSMNELKDNKCLKCNQVKGEPINALTNLTNSKATEATNLFQKSDLSTTTASNGSLFGSNGSLQASNMTSTSVPSFAFGQPAKETTGIKTETQSISKPSATSFVFGVPSSNNLNNGDLSFDSQPNTAITPNFFNNPTANTNSSIQSSFSFGSNKAQFGIQPVTNVPTNLFSAPQTNTSTNLTNGFGTAPSTELQQQPNNLFSNSTVNNFPNVFSQVPTFNFSASADPNQSQNNVFQFSAPKSDAPLTQPISLSNTHGRYIKKAKRRLAKE